MKQVLATGIIRAPHGVNGFLKVHPYSDDTSHFLKLKEVTIEKMGKTKNLEIEKVVRNKSDLLIKFVGIDNPEDARFFSGWDILVPREQACKLGKNEIYVADLIGMRLVYDNEEVGRVLSVCEGAQSFLLEVQCNDSKIRIVPYLKGVFVNPADPESNTIELLKKELVQ